MLTHVLCRFCFSTIQIRFPFVFFKGMLRRKTEHFLNKRKYEKLVFSEMN